MRAGESMICRCSGAATADGRCAMCGLVVERGKVIRLTDSTWGAYVNDQIVAAVVVRKAGPVNAWEVLRVPGEGRIELVAGGLGMVRAWDAAEAEARKLAGLD